jgi:predicted TIM-barrel fold metal-dependent hydrolase
MAKSQKIFCSITLVLVAQLFLTHQRLRSEAPITSAVQQTPGTAAPTAAALPYIDTHVHFDAKVVSDPDSEVAAALQEMPRENAARLIFMPGPFLPDDSARFDHDAFLAAVNKHPDKLAFQGGGGSLNVLIQESVRSGSASPEVRQKFKDRAEQIVRDGAVGFGEMSSEHLSFSRSQAYETAPPDHPLFLLLADIAAAHNVPIELHLDAVPQAMPLPSGLKSPPNPPNLAENLTAFEHLLTHNPRAKIVWAHAGSDGLGYRTPDLCRRLLQAHPNLYMEIKIDPQELGKNPPLAADGKIQPQWLKLFNDFPDRFVIGSDQHYASGRSMTGPQRWQMPVLLLNQLPAGLQQKIARENALRIFPIAETK